MNRGRSAATSSKVSQAIGWTASTLSVFMKLSALAVSHGLPRRAMEPSRPCSASRLRQSAEPHCDPRSEWCTQPRGGVRPLIVARSAAIASRASMERLIA